MNHFTEAEINHAWRVWRRQYRKTMLLKAIGWIGLMFLICAGTLSVLYALNW